MLNAEFRSARTRVQTLLIAIALVMFGSVAMVVSRGTPSEAKPTGSATQAAAAPQLPPSTGDEGKQGEARPEGSPQQALPGATAEPSGVTMKVAAWRLSASGNTIVAQSRVTLRGVGGAYVTPADCVTLMIPKALWDNIDNTGKRSLVGKTVEASGVWGLPDKDGETSKTLRVQALTVK